MLTFLVSFEFNLCEFAKMSMKNYEHSEVWTPFSFYGMGRVECDLF
jgi:hypothetical protein